MKAKFATALTNKYRSILGVAEETKLQRYLWNYIYPEILRSSKNCKTSANFKGIVKTEAIEILKNDGFVVIISPAEDKSIIYWQIDP